MTSDGYFEKHDGKWMVRTDRYPRVGDRLMVRRKGMGPVERVVTRIGSQDGKSRIGGGGNKT